MNFCLKQFLCNFLWKHFVFKASLNCLTHHEIFVVVYSFIFMAHFSSKDFDRSDFSTCFLIKPVSHRTAQKERLRFKKHILIYLVLLKNMQLDMSTFKINAKSMHLNGHMHGGGILLMPKIHLLQFMYSACVFLWQICVVCCWPKTFLLRTINGCRMSILPLYSYNTETSLCLLYKMSCQL